MNKLEKTCTGLHLFVGIGAMAGGSVPILEPNSPMGLSVETLQHSPFTNFLIPGLFLFFVLGVGNVFASIPFFRQWKLRAFISGFFASVLVIWIIVQCIMLQDVVALHVIFFIIGAVQGLMALYLLRSRKNV